MPDPNRGQRASANWELVVKTKPEDQIHNDYWLLNQFSQNENAGFVGKSGGDFIVCPIEYALNTTVQSYSDTDTFSTARVDVFDRLEAEWKEYIGTAVMSYLERDRNAGEGMAFDLLPAKLESLRKSERGKLNTDMYGDGTGNGGKNLTGLAALVSDTPTTGTVEGINRATFSFFRNQQTSGAGTNFNALRAAMGLIYNLCSNGVAEDHPSFGVTDLTSFNGYESLLTANERFTDKENGDGGFKNERIKYKGMRLAWDAACPAGHMYLLNADFLKLYYKTGSWMKMRDPIEPANQTIEIYAVRTMCNLVALQPRRLGVITAIA